MKDEARCVAIEEFVGLKPKMYSFLVDNNETICHNEHKNVLLEPRCSGDEVGISKY